jgi:hypothetical protein
MKLIPENLHPQNNKHTARIYIILILVILLIGISFLATLSRKNIDLDKNNNSSGDYHAPIQLSSNYPKELLVEPVVNENITINNLGSSIQTIYTYKSNNTPEKILELYSNALKKNGWIVSNSDSKGLRGNNNSSTIEITINTSVKGTIVKVVLSNPIK